MKTVPDKQNNVRIGVYEKSFPPHMSWPERLQAAADAGFDFIEIAIDPSEERLARLDWSSKEKVALCNAAADAGVPVFSVVLSAHRSYAFGSASAKTRQKSLDIMCKAFDFAVYVGVRVIQVAGYFVYDEPVWGGARDHFMVGLAHSADLASQSGIMLGLENVDGNDVTSVTTAMHFVNSINSPWLQLYPDLGNISANGLDIKTELEAGRGHIVNVHLKDARPGEFRRVPFGEGTVPFVQSFKTLAQMEYNGPVVLEMWNDNSQDPIRIVAESREWILQRLIEGGLRRAP